MPRYECAVCGLAVLVRPPEPPVRGCTHDDAPILANAQSALAGRGGVVS